MGTDSAFFVAGLVGLLAGYIVGDFQRELRWRRDAKRNLALSLERLPGADSNPGPVEHVRSGFDNFTVPGPHGHDNGDSDGGPAWALGSVRDGQARRAAISRPNHRDGSTAGLRGGTARRAAPAPVGVGYDCG